MTYRAMASFCRTLASFAVGFGGSQFIAHGITNSSVGPLYLAILALIFAGIFQGSER